MKLKMFILALSAAVSLAAPVFAQGPGVAEPLWNGSGNCTQLESSAGLRGAECGRLTLAEVAALHGDRAGG